MVLPVPFSEEPFGVDVDENCGFADTGVSLTSTIVSESPILRDGGGGGGGGTGALYTWRVGLAIDWSRLILGGGGGVENLGLL